MTHSQTTGSIESMHLYAPELLTLQTGWREEDGVDLPVFAPLSKEQEVLSAFTLFLAERYNLVYAPMIDDLTASESVAFMTEASIMESPLYALGSVADVKRESEFVKDAVEMVEKIHSQRLPGDWRLNDAGNILIRGSGKRKQRIKITGFRNLSDDHPSCQMLDLAWNRYRLQTFGSDVLTLLSSGMSEQQRQVHGLADLFPDDFSGMNQASMTLNAGTISTNSTTLIAELDRQFK